MNLSGAKENLIYAGDAIAHVMDPGHAEQALLVEELKSSDISTALRLSLGGRTAFAKVFADNRRATAAFERERKALAGLSGLNIPELLLVAETQRLLVTTFIAGKPVSETLNADNLLLMAEHVGQWLGLMSNAAPSEPGKGSWADYLENVQDGINQDIVALEGPALCACAVGKFLLAHNDNALGNFITGTDKKLYAVDFEDCRMKPEGWDLITAARAFAIRFPSEIRDITSTLLRGYNLTARNSGLSETFDGIMNILIIAFLTENASDSPQT